jgi:hypothetical protein
LPEHALKKKLVLKVSFFVTHSSNILAKNTMNFFDFCLQAIFYLERMLIQAEEQGSVPIDETALAIKADPDAVEESPAKRFRAIQSPADLTNDQDVEMRDSSLMNVEGSNKIVECGKDINIDPRTFCKLGHFHLLLDEYGKGQHRVS